MKILSLLGALVLVFMLVCGQVPARAEMTQEQKLDFVKAQFKDYIDSIETLGEFARFLEIITKEKVIIYLKARLQEMVDKHNQRASEEEGMASELQTFKYQLEEFLEPEPEPE